MKPGMDGGIAHAILVALKQQRKQEIYMCDGLFVVIMQNSLISQKQTQTSINPLKLGLMVNKN